MRRVREQSGQVSVEWVGVLAVFCAMVAALWGSGIGPDIAQAVDRQICLIAQGEEDEDCEEEPEREQRATVGSGPDEDGDGLSDREERRRGTLPGRADSDGDRLSDGDEVRLGLEPRRKDSDDDGIDDRRELLLSKKPGGPDPRDRDSDDDRLTDGQELAIGTNPRNEGWTRDEAARARISTLTRDELVDAGVTRGIATSWRDFYRAEARRNPRNPSAAGRADLLDAAVRLLE